MLMTVDEIEKKRMIIGKVLPFFTKDDVKAKDDYYTIRVGCVECFYDDIVRVANSYSSYSENLKLKMRLGSDRSSTNVSKVFSSSKELELELFSLFSEKRIKLGNFAEFLDKRKEILRVSVNENGVIINNVSLKNTRVDKDEAVLNLSDNNYIKYDDAIGILKENYYESMIVKFEEKLDKAIESRSLSNFSHNTFFDDCGKEVFTKYIVTVLKKLTDIEEAKDV